MHHSFIYFGLTRVRHVVAAHAQFLKQLRKKAKLISQQFANFFELRFVLDYFSNLAVGDVEFQSRLLELSSVLDPRLEHGLSFIKNANFCYFLAALGNVWNWLAAAVA